MQGQPKPMDGLSLLHLISDDLKERSLPIAFETTGGWESRTSRGSAKLALIDNQYKLLTDLDNNPQKDMLIDLISDPAETTNLVSKFPEIAQKMRDELTKWQQSCQHSNSGKDYIN
jgi:hypothetical protein